MKKLSLKAWISKLQLVLVRFPFTLLFIIGLAVLCFLSIQKVKVEIHESLWAFFILGLLLTVAVTLFLEEFKNLIVRISLNVLSIVLLAVYCFTLPLKLAEYQMFQLIAFGVVFVLSAFVVSFLKKNNEIPFWNFSRDSIIQLFITSIFSQVLFAGLGLAILSLDKLFSIHIDVKVYSNLAVVCFVIFAPLYFLSNIPDEFEKRKQEFTFHKIIKIFGLYILLPILAAYMLILYVYLFQIIIKWQLPNGWVSTLVSVLGMVGFLCLMILYPLRLTKENKLVDILSRFFPVVLFPLLMLMSVGIFRRIGDYGLTINRGYVLILNLWLYGISIYLFLSKANHLKWIVISFTTVLFISSVGPWSVFNVTKRSMVKEIRQLFTEAKLLKENKVIDNTDKSIQIESKLSESLAAKIEYLSGTYGNESLQPYFKQSILNLKSSEIKGKLGLEYTIVRKNRDSSKYFNINVENTNQKIELKSYSQCLSLKNSKGKENLYEDKNLKINLKDVNIYVFKKAESIPFISIPLKSKLISIIKTDQDNGAISCKEFEVTGDTYKLIVNNVSGNYFFKNDSIEINNFEANIFLK